MVWRALPARLNASHDFFIRTSDEGHKTFVQEFLQRLYDNGARSTRTSTRGCTASAARRSRPRPTSSTGSAPSTIAEPEWIEERNWFFRLSAFQERCSSSTTRATSSCPASGRTRRGASSRAGSRTSRSRAPGRPWGIPIPWDPDQVAYVWADALVNYLSALTYARPGEDLRRAFWPAVRHLLGKDILRFHCVYWPAMLLAAGYEVPRQLFVHGYLLLDDRKISKSLGNVLDPLDLVDVYGADPVRFWCARAVSFGQDGTASIAGLHERYERELGNDLGNLLSRTTAMIARYRDGVAAAVPSRTRRSPRCSSHSATTSPIASTRYDLTGALERIWEVVRALNRHVEASAPWQLAKDEARAAELDAVLYDLADGLRVVAIALARTCRTRRARILARSRQPADARLGRGSRTG